MPEFVIIIKEPAWDPATATEADWATAMAGHGAFARAVADAGAQILGGDALQPESASVKITPSGSGAIFTDGPFSETKEVVSGFYKISARDFDQAKELAALCPTGGWLEVFPVMEMNAA